MSDGTATPVAPIDGEFGYHVSIDAFSGPMDLLLYLVRRAQVDIADIPISEIADQFVATIGAWRDLDLDIAGDFILMAATLLEIKSRQVAPPVESDGVDDDEDIGVIDPRADLIAQLLEYRRFKDASDLLAGCEADAWHGAPRTLHEAIPEDPDEADGISLDNADPYLLFSAWEFIYAKIAGRGPRTVVYDDVPMEARMTAIATTMQAVGRATLRQLLDHVPHRVQKAGTLIAVLECTRQRLVEISQLEQFGEVLVRFRDQLERTTPLEPPAEESTEPKRRRRLPLMTWHAAQAARESEELSIDEPEEAFESEESRFIRELNDSCDLDSVLARGTDLEASFAAFRAAQQLPTT